MKKQIISIVTPVFNDWRSLEKLTIELVDTASNFNTEIEKIVVVNDCSTIIPSNEIINNPLIKILNLSTNLGHQRAIAIGLCYANDYLKKTSKIILMDSDGEDKPSDITKLLKKSEENEGDIIFASREKRSEKLIFKINYFIYKKIFKFMTHSEISFGNFSLIPKEKIDSIIYDPDSWNHFSASIIKSKISYSKCLTKRGKRYFGKSKMNFTNLVVHGLSSISVFTDLVIVRLLICNVVAIILAFVALSLLLIVKVFSDYEIPGWTPIYTLGIFNVLFFSLIFTLLLVLIQLNNRNMVKRSPVSFYKYFLLKENKD